jgi:apolipoprotein N-acyltransferase
MVQPNREVSLSRPMPDQGYSREFPWEMEISEKLVDEGAQILIWPEGYFFGYTFWESVRIAFRQHLARFNTPLFFYDATWRVQNQKRRNFNSILFLDEKGELIDSYDKMKLVPFSEYLPVFSDLTLFDWILGNYLDNLTPGQESKVFEVQGMRIVPKTCYEPLFPEFVAESIGQDGAGKVILVQSQDGWFGRSNQPYQHLALTVIRAVENRVPLIHVIQNGPSAVVNPEGSLAFLSQPFVRGGWVVTMPFHSHKGGSFYSRFPNLFVNSVRGLFLLLLFVSFINWKSDRAKRS